MKKTSTFILGCIGVVLLLVLIVGGMSAGQYNGLVQAKTAVETQWSQVETVYQRRFDLIPNLVETVKGFASQEQTVLGQIADARTRYAGSTSVADKTAAANQLETSLGRLLVVVENYPELKSNEVFKNLMVQLEGTENRISVERRTYNEKVQDYNLKIRQFPSNIFAGILGFKEATPFKAAEGAAEAPKVQFNSTPAAQPTR
ncbi:MAG: LemA family protein [bacterium]